jgi:D-alanyl-D-alanine carboxypeptidase
MSRLRVWGPPVAALSLMASACATTGYTAPPEPQFTSGEKARPATVTTPGSAERPVEIDPADVAADLAPGQSILDDAGWSVAEMVVTDDAGRATPNRSSWADFDTALARRLVPADWAASVAVMVDGELVHTAAFGERVPGDPAKPTDRFRVASISKTITAIVAMQLVEQGLLTLDEPVGYIVAGYLGLFPPDADASMLTLRRLLSHTSGFAQAENTFFGNGAASCTDAATRALNGSVPAAAGYRYSNMNYCVVGLLLEAVTGMAYERVVQERLLDPLGIAGMRITSTYEIGPDEVDHQPSTNRNFMETLGAAGAWNATPSDLVAILNSIDPTTPGWKALSPEAMLAMRPPMVGGYGLGLIGYGGGAWGHTGTIQNTHAMLLAQPDAVTWAVTVAGEYPSNTGQLQSIVAAALAEAFPS